MPQVNNAESMRAWLQTCPDIAQNKYFGADYLNGNATEYTLISVPSVLKYKSNIIGERKLQREQDQLFIFAAEFPFSSDVEQNLKNLGFFQDVMSWIARQNELPNFPEWEGGNITSIVCSNTGAPVQTDVSTARYQFQIKVNYETI